MTKSTTTTQPAKPGTIAYLDDLLETYERHLDNADRMCEPLSKDVKADLVYQIQTLAAKLPTIPWLDENADLLYVFSSLVMIARSNEQMTEVSE